MPLQWLPFKLLLSLIQYKGVLCVVCLFVCVCVCVCFVVNVGRLDGLISCFTFCVFLMLFVISWLCALCAFGALHSLLAICSCWFSTLLCYVFMPLFGIFLCVFLLFLGSFLNWLSLFLFFVQVWKKSFSHIVPFVFFYIFYMMERGWKYSQ